MSFVGTATTTTASATALPTRRASTQLHRDDILRLVAECDATLQRDPTCLHTRAVRGHACMKAKLWDRAIDDFSSILDQRADDVHGRFSRGMALFKSGRVDDAHRDFSRVLELNPHHVMARYARAGCYNTEGKFHHAIQEYTIALQHDEKENEAMLGLRSGKLSRGWQHDVGRFSGPKVNENGSLRSPYERADRRATVDTTAWSPRRRANQQQQQERRESATEAFSPPSLETSKPTTTKKPRKVVQVKLNLSDLAVQAEPASPLIPNNSASDAESTRPSSQPTSIVALPLTAINSDAHNTANRAAAAVASTDREVYEIPLPSSACGSQEPMPHRQPVSASTSQPTRRAVRRVTVAL